MFKSLLKIVAVISLSASFVAHSGVVVDSTRHLYKEGTREISANLENKDNIPYLVKSWVEPREGNATSFFMVTPPLFRLEAKQKIPSVFFLMPISSMRQKIESPFIILT